MHAPEAETSRNDRRSLTFTDGEIIDNILEIVNPERFEDALLRVNESERCWFLRGRWVDFSLNEFFKLKKTNRSKKL